MFSFMEKRCCIIIRGSFESVTDQLLLNNQDFIKLVRGGIASNFYTVYCVLRSYKEESWHGEAKTLKHRKVNPKPSSCFSLDLGCGVSS